MRPGSSPRSPRPQGFTYVWVMTLVAVLGIGLSAIGPLWRDDIRRDREKDVLRIGQIYAQAIANYYKASPGSVKRYPPTLDALLLDTRSVGTVRHLRRLYDDPLQPGRPWGVIRAADGGIGGVYSTSNDEPLRREPLDLGITALAAAAQYSDWKFAPKVDP